MKSFNVIIYNFNNKVFEAYDIMPYFISKYKEIKQKPKTFEEFKEFIEYKSRNQFWSRCQYEMIISDFPNNNTQEKWDIHQQIMMNINIITSLLMENCK